jgi:hypothetical protein
MASIGHGCPHGDRYCPCNDDGFPCNYSDHRGTPRDRCPRTGTYDCDCAERDGLSEDTER